MSNELHYMHDDPMPPDLESAHRRLLDDGDSWEAEQVPSSDQLAEFLRHAATQVDASIMSPDVAAAGAPSLRRVRRSQVLSSALPAIAALLLISLGAALFGVMAHSREQLPATQYPKSSCAPKQISVHGLRGIWIQAISMVSPDQGWAIGWDIGWSGTTSPTELALFQYSQCQWQPVSNTPANVPADMQFLNLNMLSAHDGWALGNVGTVDKDKALRGATILLHFNGSDWQRVPLPLHLAAGETICDLQMLSDKEGWMIVQPIDTNGVECSVDTIGTLYHSLNGVWKPVSLDYISPDKIVPFAPDEAWIISTVGQLLLYRRGTIVSFDQPPGGDITMLTPQNGWLLETSDAAYPDSPPWMNPNQGTSSQSQGPTSRMLWHFDGKRWSDESALISNSRIQTAMYVQIFSAREGWAFLATPYTIPSADPSPPISDSIVDSTLWLHNGHWQTVKWPAATIDNIYSIVEVSPVEYWAIAQYAPTNQHTYEEGGNYYALLHFVDGIWSIYS
jgi:hypothetical protein